MSTRPQKRKRHIPKVDSKSKRRGRKRLRNMLGENLLAKPPHPRSP